MYKTNYNFYYINILNINKIVDIDDFILYDTSNDEYYPEKFKKILSTTYNLKNVEFIKNTFKNNFEEFKNDIFLQNNNIFDNSLFFNFSYDITTFISFSLNINKININKI